MSGLARAGVTAAMLAGAAALIMAVRIIELDEAPTDRARAVVLLATAAGGLTGLIVDAFARIPWPKTPTLQAALAVPVAASLFGPLMPILFSLHNRVIEGRLDGRTREMLSGSDWFHALYGGAGLFTPTGQHYLLPWPWPLLAVTAGLVVLSLARRRPQG